MLEFEAKYNKYQEKKSLSTIYTIRLLLKIVYGVISVLNKHWGDQNFFFFKFFVGIR